MIMVKRYIKMIKSIINILSILIFILSSIFTLITINKIWNYKFLAYSLLITFFINLILFIFIFFLKKHKKKSLVNITNILRKLTSLASVVISLVITFILYRNNTLSLLSKVLMSCVSFSMAFIYIGMQLLILVIREKKDAFIKRIKQIKKA